MFFVVSFPLVRCPWFRHCCGTRWRVGESGWIWDDTGCICGWVVGWLNEMGWIGWISRSYTSWGQGQRKDDNLVIGSAGTKPLYALLPSSQCANGKNGESKMKHSTEMKRKQMRRDVVVVEGVDKDQTRVVPFSQVQRRSRDRAWLFVTSRGTFVTSCSFVPVAIFVDFYL